MKNNDFIESFINGPLKEYLQGHISFAKFKERTNEVCNTNFTVNDLNSSYLLNATLQYKDEFSELQKELGVLTEEDKKYMKCHQYCLCSSNLPLEDCVVGICSFCPRSKENDDCFDKIGKENE